MMSSMDLFFPDDNTESVNLAFIRRKIRDASNPMDLPDVYFYKIFRMAKEAFNEILGEVTTFLRTCVHSRSVPHILKLAAVKRFLAEGNYQNGVGRDFNLAIAQPTFSKILTEMLNIFEQKICPKHINLKLTPREKEEAKLSFFARTGFPGVIGCVDGTHIRISSPNKEIQHLFYNRKGFHSINAMMICNHKMQIRFVDARYAGSCHDSYVWMDSDAKLYFQQQFSEGIRNEWLLGDSGYPLEPYLITPFRSSLERSLESCFNKLHSKARNVIERVFGILKNKFRCILGARELHYNPKKVSQIVNVCCCLHNLCITFRLNENETSEDNYEDENNQYDQDDTTLASEEQVDHINNAVGLRNTIMRSVNYN